MKDGIKPPVPWPPRRKEQMEHEPKEPFTTADLTRENLDELGYLRRDLAAATKEEDEPLRDYLWGVYRDRIIAIAPALIEAARAQLDLAKQFKEQQSTLEEVLVRQMAKYVVSKLAPELVAKVMEENAALKAGLDENERLLHESSVGWGTENRKRLEAEAKLEEFRELRRFSDAQATRIEKLKQELEALKSGRELWISFATADGKPAIKMEPPQWDHPNWVRFREATK